MVIKKHQVFAVTKAEGLGDSQEAIVECVSFFMKRGKADESLDTWLRCIIKVKPKEKNRKPHQVPNPKNR